MQRRSDILRRCERRFVRQRLEEFGLCPPDGALLMQLSGGCCKKQEDLCHYLEIDKSRITRSLNRLEDMNLIRRTVSPQNRRENVVELTEEGTSLLQTIGTIFQDWNDICYEGFSSEERNQCEAFLNRMIQNVVSYGKGQL